MGLDIYFEKRKANATFTKYENILKKQREIEKKENELCKGLNETEVWEVVKKLNNGEEPLGCGEATMKAAKAIQVLWKKWLKLEDEAEKANPHKQIAYFRKVNFLIPFFDYVDDCSYIEIEKSQVEDLVEKCREVLAAKAEKEEGDKVRSDEELEEAEVALKKKADELLPTQCGFFFGNTEYDEYYFRDVRDVLETFEQMLEDTDWENEIVEMYCWW